jgi:hypothetical protein
MLYKKPHQVAAKYTFPIIKYDRPPVGRVAEIIFCNSHYGVQNKFCFQLNILLNLFVQCKQKQGTQAPFGLTKSFFLYI